MNYRMMSYAKITKKTSNRAEDDLVIYLRRIARKAAAHLDVSFEVFNRFPVDHPDAKNSAGVCLTKEKTIYINLYNSLTGALLPIEDLIDTTLHEVVHLKHPDDYHHHSKAFWKTFEDLQDWYFEERKRND